MSNAHCTVDGTVSTGTVDSLSGQRGQLLALCLEQVSFSPLTFSLLSAMALVRVPAQEDSMTLYSIVFSTTSPSLPTNLVSSDAYATPIVIYMCHQRFFPFYD